MNTFSKIIFELVTFHTCPFTYFNTHHMTISIYSPCRTRIMLSCIAIIHHYFTFPLSIYFYIFIIGLFHISSSPCKVISVFPLPELSSKISICSEYCSVLSVNSSLRVYPVSITGSDCSDPSVACRVSNQLVSCGFY